MRIYFSSTNLRHGLEEAFLESRPKNLLFSYFYRSSYNEWTSLIRRLPEKPNIIIDSGAFSAWTSGKRINREDYLRFIKLVKSEWTQYANEIHIVNIDFIPGEFGRKPTLSEINESANIGWDNFLWFKAHGVKTIHVFHQHEDFEWLKKIISQCDYVGISPANDLNTKQRLPWIKQCFYITRDKVKTHCFGGTAKEILLSVPFYSADSSSHLLARVYGPQFDKYHITGKVKNRDMIEILKKKMKSRIADYQKLERHATEVWESRGIVYDR